MANEPSNAITSSPEQPDKPEVVIDQITSGLRAQSEQVVPWFLEQMPPTYFQDTDEETRLVHLRAIIAARASGR
ncbi:MAG: hypothetical protein VX527_05135, partial [Planctomycetota bacterium]|nr:hypothetical protein [Planctomycetota bacterium]